MITIPHHAMFGIYIHIPFCRTVCPYCDFVRERVDGAAPDAYVDAVCREIERFEGPEAAGSVFFGGGTPSLLRPESLERILGTVAHRFRLDSPEITLEANPDDVTAPLARAWRDLGVNRISLGVQSFDDAVLRALGRRHNADRARDACALVAAHFENWSMDLIFGARPVEAWWPTLDECMRLDPPHVSAYGLTYEAGTPFEKRASEALDQERALRLYEEAEVALAAFDHYEISNFAKPGFAARHNLIYWRNEAYAGFGTAAFSFVDGVRARNLTDTRAYMQEPGKKSESLRLSDHEIRVETLIQHFRLREGLLKAYYRRRFGVEARADFCPQLDALCARGLIEEDKGAFRPTREGFYLNNEIGIALV